MHVCVSGIPQYELSCDAGCSAVSLTQYLGVCMTIWVT